MTDRKRNTQVELEWDAFVAQHPDGHPEQSSAFGRNRKEYGFDCDRVIVREEGRIVGGAQILSQRTPFGRVALVLRAPLAHADNPRILGQVIRHLNLRAQLRAYASIRVELFPTQSRVRHVLERSGFLTSAAWADLGERPSLVVPLSLPQEVVLAKMKQRGRYNIKLAERSGVKVELGDRSSIGEFFKLYMATAEVQGFRCFPKEYFEELWTSLGAAGKMQLFLARHEGSAIAAIITTIVGSRCYYTWGGMNREPAYAKMCANYALHYFAMGWARARGCTHYDLSGISEFKERLGLEEIKWSLPLQRYCGALGEVRRHLVETTWKLPWMRRVVLSSARRLGLKSAMPH